MNNQQRKNTIEIIVSDFVKSLKGRFKKHISDELLKTILSDNLDIKCRENSFKHIENISYSVAQKVFEIYLEHGCRIIMNGHHVAQDFASYFKGKQELVIDNYKMYFPLKDDLKNANVKIPRNNLTLTKDFNSRYVVGHAFVDLEDDKISADVLIDKTMTEYSHVNKALKEGFLELSIGGDVLKRNGNVVEDFRLTQVSLINTRSK